MKKLKIVSMFILCVFISIFIFNFSYAVDDEDLEDYNNINEVLSQETFSDINKDLNLNSRSCVIIDRNSKRILYGKNPLNKVKMASTTKIMTCLVVLENSNLADVVEVSKKAANTGGSRLGLTTGCKITVEHLLYGLMLCSGNDAAVALSEHVGGSVSGFAELMNKKAEELGLNNTHFVSPHGLDEDEHYTTAYELALLTDYALKNSTFAKIVGTKNYTVLLNGNPKNINNTNELLGNLNGVYGVKTGFTNGANRCLVSSCKRGDLDVISVVLGADTKKFRTQDSVKLIEYAFKNYKMVNIEDIVKSKFEKWKNENTNYFTVIKGVSNNIEPYMNTNSNPTYVALRNDELENLKITVNCDKILNSPVSANTKLGTLELKINDDLSYNYDILSKNSIEKKDTFDYLIDFYKSFFDYCYKITL